MYTDIAQRYKLISALRPVATSGAANTDGITIDTAQHDGLAFHIDVGAGAIGDSDIAVTLFEGDESDMSDETAANGDFIIGALPSIEANNTDYTFGFNPNKRYVRLKFQTFANAAATIEASAVLKSEENPVTLKA